MTALATAGASAAILALAGHLLRVSFMVRYRFLLAGALAVAITTGVLALWLRRRRVAVLLLAGLFAGALLAPPAYVLAFVHKDILRARIHGYFLPHGLAAGEGGPLSPSPEEEAALRSLAQRVDAVIAWSSNRDGNPELYWRPRLDAPPERLTRTPAAEANPCFSPDGTCLYFTRFAGPEIRALDGPEIWSLDLDSRRERRVTSGAYPRLSADGRRMSFFRKSREEAGTIWFRDLESGKEKKVFPDGKAVPGDRACALPDLRPDGRAFAFARAAPAGGWIVLWGPDEGGEVRFVGLGCRPAWSPDGERLAWIRRGMLEVLVSDAEDGGEGTRVAPNPPGEISYFPNWANHPRLIVFARGRHVQGLEAKGVFEVYVLDLGSGGPVRMTFHGNNDIHPALYVRGVGPAPEAPDGPGRARAAAGAEGER